MKRKRRLTNEERKHREEKRRRRDEATSRKVHDFLLFWMVCREGQCRRARRCVGDTRPCFGRHWPLVPEPIKEGFRAMIKAHAEGLPEEEIHRLSDEAMARSAARIAEGATG